MMAVLVSLTGIWIWAQRPRREPDVPYVPTPPKVVERMLQIAGVTEKDIVYDLGCGDGRIVIMAAKKFGARGVGVDIDPERIKESRENARKAGVTHRVKFFVGDLFETDIREATVITLYLLPSVNLKLRPKLFRELRPGTRIVSHDFDMGEWQPDRHEQIQSGYRSHDIYFWVIPAGVAGTWRWEIGKSHYTLKLRQRFQEVQGTVQVDGKELAIRNARLLGPLLRFTLVRTVQGEKVTMRFEGWVKGDTIRGYVTVKGGPFTGTHQWVAKRRPVRLVGTWRWAVPHAGGSKVVRLALIPQRGLLSAFYLSDGGKKALEEFYTWGAQVYFTVREGQRKVTYDGVLEGNRIVGTRAGSEWGSWVATRE